MSLMFKNVIIRIEVTVFRDFVTLVKYVQILSLFNQAYYYTNYFVFNVFEVTVFRDFITLVKYVQILSLFNQAHNYTNYCVFNV